MEGLLGDEDDDASPRDVSPRDFSSQAVTVCIQRAVALESTPAGRHSRLTAFGKTTTKI